MTAAAESAPKHTNRLIHETSPYLLQHAHNPVEWHPWGEEALRRAREEGKPILLSVGYSACHWCHVMERESFEDEQIAALMNRWFINIKVDREERPDIDHIYMSAVQMMTGQGGWPMTVFLTPEGRPFYGGTYYPPEDRYGRPGFPRILHAVAEAWENRRDEIEEQSGAMLGQMRQMSEVDLPETPVTPEILDRAYQKLRASYDSRLGGVGGAPKFPQPMILDFLLRYAHRTKRDEMTSPGDMAVFTLEKMAEGGIYDQLGGGFHRYSTDEYWLVPHFEKMLYDNAQLAQTYLRAWQATGEPFFRRIAEETLDYVSREMTAPDGGFYSTQDADSEGVEGKFFVWSQAEVEEALGKEDALLFSRYYDVTPRGNWEHANILNVTAPEENFARSLKMDPEKLKARLAEMRRKLFAVREQRTKPHRDEKVLTSWNGLMLAAFAEAAAVLDRDDYRQTAIANAEFVLDKLYEEGRLWRTGKADKETRSQGDKETIAGGAGQSAIRNAQSAMFKVSAIPGFLEDYAYYADGLLRLYEATADWRWLDSAKELVDTMVELFADPEGGPFYSTPADGEALIERPRDLTDNATPSGNSVAVEVLLRLGVLTADQDYHRRAASILRQMNALLAEHPAAFGRMLGVADFYLGPVKELAVIGAIDDPATHALLSAARSSYQPNMVVAVAHPADMRHMELPLLQDRPLVDGKPTAYLCENYACQRPTTDPAELAKQLTAI
jgi:uncharacterized protein YyaL (SSP411 family)